MDQRHWLSEYLVSSDSKILFEKKLDSIAGLSNSKVSNLESLIESQMS